jgi:hypothetical protein
MTRPSLVRGGPSLLLTLAVLSGIALCGSNAAASLLSPPEGKTTYRFAGVDADGEEE